MLPPFSLHFTGSYIHTLISLLTCYAHFFCSLLPLTLFFTALHLYPALVPAFFLFLSLSSHFPHVFTQFSSSHSLLPSITSLFSSCSLCSYRPISLLSLLYPLHLYLRSFTSASTHLLLHPCCRSLSPPLHPSLCLHYCLLSSPRFVSFVVFIGCSSLGHARTFLCLSDLFFLLHLSGILSSIFGLLLVPSLLSTPSPSPSGCLFLSYPCL